MNNYSFSPHQKEFITLGEKTARRPQPLTAWAGQIAVTTLILLVTLTGCSPGQAQLSVERVPTTFTGLEVAPANVTPAELATEIIGPGAVSPNGQIAKISDGDTVTVRFDSGATEKVRLIGIDTPETKRPNTPIQCFGPEATQFTTALIPVGTKVRVERDIEVRDRYDRLLGYVYRAADGLFVNEALAANGYANLLTYPPNVAHVDTFRDAVSAAREANRGLWRACPATVRP
jgi:micrococcal nuclease